MSFEEVEKKVRVALDKLREKEQKIIANNISERAITHKLAEYLQLEFPDYNVDCEYNRNFEEGQDKPKSIEVIRQKVVKKIEGQKITQIFEEFTEQVSTYPDIIIHNRLTNERNLLVVEVKKSNNNTDWSIDDEKLNYFTDQTEKYKYKFGLHIEIFVRAEWQEPVLRWFVDGKLIEQTEL